jgi:hypothetical protein
LSGGPLAGDAFQRLLPAVFEGDLRADDEVVDRRGDEDLARPCQCGDTRADVHGDAGDAVVGQFDLTRVQSCPDLQS